MKPFNVVNGGATLKVELAGAGPGVVFLHAGVADRRMWREQVSRFESSYTAVAYDRRGFGETVCQDETFSNGEDLASVLDYLELETPVLVGCSQGGRVAIDFTLAQPERVSALILVSPAVSGAPTPTNMPAETQGILEELERAEEADDLERVNAIEAHLWLDGPASPEGRVSGQVRDLFLDMNGVALRAPELTLEQEPPSAFERLAEITVPTLLLWGDLDFSHVQARCRHLSETLPNVQAEVMIGTAHLPNLEQPENFNDLVLGFLEQL